jgi:DNA repair exonuclease SbcCD nuclease subunit
MKVALITDTHWGARNDSLNFINFYEKFYANVFLPKLIEEKITTLLMLGDTFDRRKYINYVTLHHAKKIFFDKLQELGIKTYILAGNHDTSYKNTNEVNSPVLLLQEYSNIIVIDKPMTIHLNYENPSDDIAMIPWICADNYQQCLDEIKNTTATLCAGHFEIAGFSMYRGHPCQEGLQRDIFRKFEYTFSGHYHHKSSSDSIYYLGNPYELTWQDYNDSRGFHIFDLDTRNLDFIKNPYVMFHRIVYDDKTNSIEQINNLITDQYTNTYVKVIVVNKTNPYIFDTFIDKLYSVNPADLNIVEDFTDLSEGIDEEFLDQSEDTISLLSRYVESIKEDSINNDKLKTILRELYVEALNIQ